MFIDTHCHLDFDKFDQDREEVIMRAVQSDVNKMINVGVSIRTSKESIVLAEKYDGVYAAIGIHPEEIKIRRQCGDCLEDWLKRKESDLQNILKAKIAKKVVAIGEIGVDYHWMTVSRETQLEVFKMQVKLAKEFDLPVILHCREAQEDVMSSPYEEAYQILVELNIKKSVFHCFSGSLEFARKAWEAGYFTSFTGIITYPKSDNLRNIVKEAPIDKIMIETDCPFLAPQKFRGQRNEPKFVKEVAGEIAKVKGMEIGEVEEVFSRNTEKFFAI